MDDLVSEVKNTGSSAFGNSTGSGTGSGSGSGSGSGGVGGLFSNIFNMTIQKIALLLAGIALIISTATVAILLWKSKNSQKWPPEISKCPDRWVQASDTTCRDPYGLYGTSTIPTSANNCANYSAINGKKYTNSAALTSGYIPWEGILDGDGTRSSSLKC
jgi:hypothetical protein